MPDKPKVIVLAGKLHPYGGIETHLFHFCVFFADLADITLVITSKDYAAASKAALERRGVKICEFNCGTRLDGILEYIRCIFFLRRQRAHDSVLYSNGTSGFAYLAGINMYSRMWVHHHHGDISFDICRSFPFFYKRALKNCDWLIACTPGHAKILDREFQRRDRTVFLPYLKAEAVFNAQSRTKRHGNMVIGFFGRLRESKGVGTLLALASWFMQNGIECRLHGDNCENLVSLPLPAPISWKGPYNSSEDLDELFSSIEVMVLPTVFGEGLPIVVSEAISRGVPVVAYPGGGLREMAGFHAGVMIIEPNVAAFKKALLEMRERLKSRELNESLAKKYQTELSNGKTVGWWRELLITRK